MFMCMCQFSPSFFEVISLGRIFLSHPPGGITLLKLVCVLLAPVFMLLLFMYVPITIYSSALCVLKINITYLTQV